MLDFSPETFALYFHSDQTGAGSLARTVTGNLPWMTWNVLLAWIPALLGFLTTRTSGAASVVATVACVAFLPNAPYVLTDLEHLVPELRALDGGRAAGVGLALTYGCHAA